MTIVLAQPRMLIFNRPLYYFDNIVNISPVKIIPPRNLNIISGHAEFKHNFPQRRGGIFARNPSRFPEKTTRISSHP